jgi:hypothetical protein
MYDELLNQELIQWFLIHASGAALDGLSQFKTEQIFAGNPAIYLLQYPMKQNTNSAMNNELKFI